jgi:mRNA-degrading endonuclease YafQ of YafQ-DinJ toxin-antitoxin module
VLRLLKKYSQEPSVNLDLLCALLTLARTVAKSENNKSRLLTCYWSAYRECCIDILLSLVF